MLQSRVIKSWTSAVLLHKLANFFFFEIVPHIMSLQNDAFYLPTGWPAWPVLTNGKCPKLSPEVKQDGNALTVYCVFKDNF